MLTLNDGRSELWQWDTGRKLSVDADCSQVHFSNKVFGRSIDVDVVDGVAIIPDVLLQTDKDLNVWAFVGTAENGYTKISKTFKVNRRNKPADYVFTPPDQTTLGELVERLGKIEESQDPDAIKNAVDDYLANNPIMVKETDPTVPEWAKYPTKPSYTAAEVGAQPAGNYLTEIEIKPVIEATNSAQALAKQADKKVDTLREVVSKFHSNIVEEAKGDIITLDDASDMELAGLTLYGKTTQNGTPTPEAPIPLESVGDDGNVAVTVCGKNLFDGTLVGGYKDSLNGTQTGDGNIFKTINFRVLKAGAYTFSFGVGVRIVRYDGTTPTTDCTAATYNLDAGDHYISFRNQANTAWDSSVKIQLEPGMTATEYEPYNGQSLTAQTPNGLPGIPVSSGGNYTDENGQQWICDEIDFYRGVYIQRVANVVIDESTKWTVVSTDTTGKYRYCCALERKAMPFQDAVLPPMMCNCATIVIVTGTFSLRSGVTTANDGMTLYFYDDAFSSGDVTLLQQYLAESPMRVLYLLATPVETDLSAEEIAQYSTLHTNYPNTTVYNDEGAGMAVKYVADTKLYIDNKFAELAAAILNNA